MRRSRQVLIVLLALLPLAGQARATTRGLIVLERGVGVQARLNPAAPADPATSHGLQDLRSIGDLEWIQARGFDFVRLIVDAGPLLTSRGKQSDDAVAEIEKGVRILTDRGLRVILSLRHVDDVEPHLANYRKVVASLAEMLVRVGSKSTALALTDEQGSRYCRSSKTHRWQKILGEFKDAARGAAPDLTLVVSGVCGDIDGLIRLGPKALDDSRLIYSFEFFEPEKFTRQGVGDAQDVKGIPWPADDVATDLAMIYSKLLLSQSDLSAAEWSARLTYVRRYIAIYEAGSWNETQVKARFAALGAWAEKHAISKDRLLLGAFGVVAANEDRGGALAADRFRWLSAVRREADALGVAWAVQNYDGVDSITMDALGMSKKKASLPVEGWLETVGH